MKVVIDTNVLLSAIYRRSKNYWIRLALEQRQITLCTTTDILDEYAEVIGDYYDATTSDIFLSALEILPNILYINCFEIIALILKDQNPDVTFHFGKRNNKFFKVEFGKSEGYIPHIVAKKLGLIQ